MNILQNLANKSIKSDRPINILSFLYNGKFDRDLLATGHNFFGITRYSYQGWLDTNDNVPNLTLLNHENDLQNIPFIDLILFNNRLHREAFSMCERLHAPGIIVDHELFDENPYICQKLSQDCPFESVACSKSIQKSLNSTNLIEYGVDNYTGQNEKDIDILVVGNFDQSHSYIIKQLVQKFPGVKIIGNNSYFGFIEKLNHYSDYESFFKRAKVFVNIPHRSPMPNQLSHRYQDILLAKKYQCKIVSYKSNIYDDVLDKNNASFYDNITEIPAAIYNSQYTTPDTTLTFNTKDNFITSWNELLNRYKYRIYR